MSLFTISAAATYDDVASTGGAGLHIWSGNGDKPHHSSAPLRVASQMHGTLAMIATGLDLVSDAAKAGDVVHIAIPGGQAALEHAQPADIMTFVLIEHALNVITYLTRSLRTAGVTVTWIEPVCRHSGIGHARVQAMLAKCAIAPLEMPRAA